MKVGFIGLGSIGTPMAMQIARAGFPLVVHDVRREACDPLVEMGAAWAGSPAAVAEQSDVVCTCLPGPAEMETVLTGDDGILEALRPGAVYVDHTTNSPSLVQRMAGLVGERGAEMLDAPVSGGREGAGTRDLTVLAGGPAAAFDRVRPVLDAMAKTVMRVGEVGAGCVCKIAHNSASFSIDLAMVECLTLGIRAGIDPAVMVEVFQKCAVGRNFGIQVRAARHALQRRLRPPVRAQARPKGHRLGNGAGAGARRPDACCRAVRGGDVGGGLARMGRPRQLHLPHATGGAGRGAGESRRVGAVREPPLREVGVTVQGWRESSQWREPANRIERFQPVRGELVEP